MDVMDAVLFIGLQASGKSSFYKDRFFRTHMRISLDMLRTHHREAVFLGACLDTGQRFVVDKMNVTQAQRAVYITKSRNAGFRIVGYYFRSSVEECLRRNAARQSDERVPDKAILGMHKQLQLPELAEGFDELYHVRLEGGRFVVEDWQP